MKRAERIFGHAICWGLTAILAAVNIAYLKTLGDVEIFGGQEVTRSVMIGASVAIDVGLIWSTARVLHHAGQSNWGRALAAMAFWTLCAGISAHSAYGTISMLGSAATSKADAGASARADKRDDLRRAKDNLAAIQGELRKAPAKRRADELKAQEGAAKVEIAQLEKEVAALPVTASATPAKGFEFYVAGVLIALPVLAMVALSDGHEAPAPSPERPKGRREVDGGPAGAREGAHSGQVAGQLWAGQENQGLDADIILFKPRGVIAGGEGDAQAGTPAEQVRALAAEGLSQVAIAKQLGIGRATVQRRLKKKAASGDA